MLFFSRQDCCNELSLSNPKVFYSHKAKSQFCAARASWWLNEDDLAAYVATGQCNIWIHLLTNTDTLPYCTGTGQLLHLYTIYHSYESYEYQIGAKWITLAAPPVLGLLLGGGNCNEVIVMNVPRWVEAQKWSAYFKTIYSNVGNAALWNYPEVWNTPCSPSLFKSSPAARSSFPFVG